MNIQGLSMEMAQTGVQAEAGVRVQAMVLNNVKDNAEDLARLMDAAQVITDPARGNHLDLLA